ncbi:hypothetical protein [Caulobacter sp. 1776]|uniref:hypothetical protein n=1 Tax=Caulobacter sp. 1776 TaxID=3156420 RepID=UPI00339AED1D
MDGEYVYFSEHLVRYEDQDGEEQEFAITFEFGSDHEVEADGDVILAMRTGRARFEFLGDSFSVRALGENEVQLVYRLMKICGSQLLWVSENGPFELYQYQPGDAKDALDFFK